MRPRLTVESNQTHQKRSNDKSSQRQQRRSLSASKVDHRDIDEMIRFVVDLMNEINPPESNRYSSGTFQLKPSQKTLITVLTTLLRQYDQALANQDIELDSISDILKFIGYPNTINKNVFQPVGAPHTWPTLIGVMYWLAQLVRYRRNEIEAGEERKELYEESELLEEIIVQAFNENPDPQTAQIDKLQEILQTQINEEKGSIAQAQEQKALIITREKEINNTYPDLSLLERSVQATDRNRNQELEELRSLELQNSEAEQEIQRMLQEEADVDEQLKRFDRENSQMELKIKATGTNSQRVQAAQAEIARIQSKMKKRKDEHTELVKLHEGKINGLLSRASEIQEKVEAIKRMHAQDAHNLKLRGLEPNIRNLPIEEMEAILKDASLINFQQIEEFYQEQLEELKNFTQKRLAQNQAEREAIERDVEKVETDYQEVGWQVQQQIDYLKKLEEETQRLQKLVQTSLQRNAESNEAHAKSAKAKEEAQAKLLKLVRERQIDQEDLDHRALKLEAMFGWIEGYAKRCQDIISGMTLEAQQYEEETKVIMKKQATSFAMLYQEMEKEYGPELTRRN